MKKFLDEVDDTLSFVIFYGSQLGQAKSIAEGLVDVAEQEYEFKTKCFELNVVKDVNDLTKLSCPIVIITSTTGDGEPPESADKFWRKIRRKNLASTLLESVKYTLLGLGDTNYNNFCNCGKVINRRLLDLGASTFYPSGWADDAIGLDLVIDDWIENLWPALEQLIRPNSKMAKSGGVTMPSCPPVSLKLEWLGEQKIDVGGGGDAPIPSLAKVDLMNPLLPYQLIDGDPVKMSLKRARILTKPEALKTALELTFEFKESTKPFKFEPGDAINVVCPNDELEVDQLLERLKLTDKAKHVIQLSVKEGAKGKIPGFLPATVGIRDAFLYYFDIRSCPKKNFIRLLGEFTEDPSEKSRLLHLCSRQGSSDFEEIIRFSALSLLDLLLTFPTCQPPVEALLEHLPRLAPRAYSISSSPLVNDSLFTFVFNLVRIPKDKGRHYDRVGVCTGWLYNKCKNLLLEDSGSLIEEGMKALSIEHEDIIVYRRKNQTFKLPENLAAPVIMVGPGTGVAPFVGFIQHRSKLEGLDTSGPMTLFFGCRHKERDFLYQSELESHVESGVLQKFYPVFSRDDPENKIKYVQHKMEENKEEVVETLLEGGGYFYVCGDARNMAKDVRETLIRCVVQVKNVKEEEAKMLVAKLTTEKRYLQDIWT